MENKAYNVVIAILNGCDKQYDDQWNQGSVVWYRADLRNALREEDKKLTHVNMYKVHTCTTCTYVSCTFN